MQNFHARGKVRPIPQFYDNNVNAKAKNTEKCEIFLMKFSRFCSVDSREREAKYSYFYHLWLLFEHKIAARVF